MSCGMSIFFHRTGKHDRFTSPLQSRSKPRRAAALFNKLAYVSGSSLGNPVFLKQDAEKKEVEIYIIATFDKSNYGMNFNGMSKSEGGYEIPLGWKVKATFCNNSDVPHSVMVVEEDVAETKINLGDEPYFEGATTPKPNTTGTTNQIEKFEFTPDEAGDFALACGFPTHSANGHRIYLKIKKDLKEAAFVMPEKKKE